MGCGVIFLQDDATTHTAIKTKNLLQTFGYDILAHPPHSPDLAPSDFSWRLLNFFKIPPRLVFWRIVTSAMSAAPKPGPAQGKLPTGLTASFLYPGVVEGSPLQIFDSHCQHPSHQKTGDWPAEKTEAYDEAIRTGLRYFVVSIAPSHPHNNLPIFVPSPNPFPKKVSFEGPI